MSVCVCVRERESVCERVCVQFVPPSPGGVSGMRGKRSLSSLEAGRCQRYKNLKDIV